MTSSAVFQYLIALLTKHYDLAYLILFLGSYLETIIGIGFFVYGELFFLSGAILAGTGVLNIWLVSLACVLGGILGDSSSYFIGRRYGKRLIKKYFKKGNKYLNMKNYRKGERGFRKHGLKTIFFARLLGPLSWVTPFIAGILGIEYRKFLMYNIPGVIVGIGEFMVIGYLFGFAYAQFLPKIGEYTVIFTAASILIIIGYIVAKRLWAPKPE